MIQNMQVANNDWGALAKATGGYLKPEKCSAYILCYRFVRGRAKLMNLTHLPEPTDEVLMKDGTVAPSHLTVPQPDGSLAPIPTLDVTESSKMLGVHFSPAGDSTSHIVNMREKGYKWVERLKTRPLPPRDAWFSFDNQLVHGLSWGLVTVILPPATLDYLIQKLYFKALPLLGVNRCITKEWRCLPEMFQGLGLPNFVIRALADKIHFMQCHWGFEGVTSAMLLFAFEAFLMEIGLYGNIFTLDYKKFGCLATDKTWFKTCGACVIMLEPICSSLTNISFNPSARAIVH